MALTSCLVRCGLESNGAPEFQPNGQLRYGLHGKIANLPADKVEVEIDGDSGRIAIRGTVDEARIFGSKLRLETSIETVAGRPGLAVHDKVTNLSAAASDFDCSIISTSVCRWCSRIAGCAAAKKVSRLATPSPPPICRRGTSMARDARHRPKSASIRNRPVMPMAIRRPCFTIRRQRRA